MAPSNDEIGYNIKFDLRSRMNAIVAFTMKIQYNTKVFITTQEGTKLAYCTVVTFIVAFNVALDWVTFDEPRLTVEEIVVSIFVFLFTALALTSPALSNFKVIEYS